MSLSKDADRKAEPPASPPNRRRRLFFTAAICAAAAAAGACIVLWESAAAKLDRARAALEEIATSPTIDQRRQHAAEALEAVEPLRSTKSSEGETASLFWCAATAVLKNGEIPDDAFAAVNLAQVATGDVVISARLLFNTGNFGKADQLIAVALERSDHREEVLRLAGVIRFELGRDDDVLAHCRELSELAPNDPDPWKVAAMVHRNRGHWDHFVDAARESLQRSEKDDGEFRQELVDGLVHLGQTKEARREFDRVARERPDLPPLAPLLEARLLLLEGRSDAVAPIVEAFLRRHPDHPEGLLLQGKLQLAQERFGQAIRTLERLIAVDPANHDAHYQLGQALSRTGEDDERAQRHLRLHREILDSKVKLYHLEQMAASDPSNVTVRRELARNYARLGMNDLADFWTRAANAAAER